MNKKNKKANKLKAGSLLLEQPINLDLKTNDKILPLDKNLIMKLFDITSKVRTVNILVSDFHIMDDKIVSCSNTFDDILNDDEIMKFIMNSKVNSDRFKYKTCRTHNLLTNETDDECYIKDRDRKMESFRYDIDCSPYIKQMHKIISFIYEECEVLEQD